MASFATLVVLFILVAVFLSSCTGTRIREVAINRQAHCLTKPVTLKIVTYNIQDIYFVSTYRIERMRAIAEKLCQLDPDIVGFQESFIRKDRNILIEGLKKGSRLQYHQHYPSGVVGSGLLISSAFPITERSFLRFTDSNPFYKVTEGDWWAGKGVALARVELPDGIGFVDFYNTHTQAGYGNPAYEIVRKNQMTELARFVNRYHTGTTQALFVGDMNCKVGRDDFEVAVKNANLLRIMNIDSGVDHIFAVKDPGYTFELLDTIKIEGRIHVNGEDISLSDHSGYMSTVRIIPRCNTQ
ncbi:MAG: endonuclease/exonuclease/phosphatase family protein [Planctomycetota bacterium]